MPNWLKPLAMARGGLPNLAQGETLPRPLALNHERAGMNPPAYRPCCPSDARSAGQLFLLQSPLGAEVLGTAGRIEEWQF
jgi:hypothetical protein